jgi:photosystem II stability/assembly factor-like uncharacterized protein
VPFDASATAFGQGITLDPCDAGTLYFSVVGFDPTAAKAGIYKTTNAGSTWTKVGPLDEPINIVVDPRNPQHLYASDGVRGATHGFWSSTDGGATWTNPQSFIDAAKQLTCCDTYHVDADPGDYDHVLVSFHYGDGILESFDAGATWTVHQPDPRWANAGGYDVLFLRSPTLDQGDGRRWIYGTQGKGYWLTTDAGTSWNKVSDVSMEHGGAELYYTTKGVLYLSGTSNIIRSTDNGATFTPLSKYNNISAFLSVYGDGTNLYAGSHGGGVFVTAKESDDMTWTAFNAQTFPEGPFQMAYDAANGILYSSNIRGGAWALKVKP